MKHIVFAAGSPTDLIAFELAYTTLGHKTINEYLREKGILQLEKPLLMSCHRTPKRVISYAKDCEKLSGRTIAVFIGGLSFALPGIFAAETATLPIIGVPYCKQTTHGGDLDAATAVYNLPPGTPVGGSPPHSTTHISIDKAVLIAERILDIEAADTRIKLKGAEYESIRKLFGEELTDQLLLKKDAKTEITVHSTKFDIDMIAVDNNSYLALQTRIPHYTAFSNTLAALKKTNNTLYFGRHENRTHFLARTLAMTSTEIKDRLEEHHERKTAKTEERYGTKIKITNKIFR